MVKRFHDPGDWIQSPTGEYVLGSDYDAIAAQLSVAAEMLPLTVRLRQTIGEQADRIRSLKADVADVAKINVDLMKRNREIEDQLQGEHIDFLQRWMRTDNSALGGSAPIELMRMGLGHRVATFIDSAFEASSEPETSAQRTGGENG